MEQSLTWSCHFCSKCTLAWKPQIALAVPTIPQGRVFVFVCLASEVHTPMRANTPMHAPACTATHVHTPHRPALPHPRMRTPPHVRTHLRAHPAHASACAHTHTRTHALFTVLISSRHWDFCSGVIVAFSDSKMHLPVIPIFCHMSFLCHGTSKKDTNNFAPG